VKYRKLRKTLNRMLSEDSHTNFTNKEIMNFLNEGSKSMCSNQSKAEKDIFRSRLTKKLWELFFVISPDADREYEFINDDSVWIIPNYCEPSLCKIYRPSEPYLLLLDKIYRGEYPTPVLSPNSFENFIPMELVGRIYAQMAPNIFPNGNYSKLGALVLRVLEEDESHFKIIYGSKQKGDNHDNSFKQNVATRDAFPSNPDNTHENFMKSDHYHCLTCGNKIKFLASLPASPGEIEVRRLGICLKCDNLMVEYEKKGMVQWKNK
jgi:hypothetical protein